MRSEAPLPDRPDRDLRANGRPVSPSGRAGVGPPRLVRVLERRWSNGRLRARLGRGARRALRRMGAPGVLDRGEMENGGGCERSLIYGAAEEARYETPWTHPSDPGVPQELRARSVRFEEAKVFELGDVELVGSPPTAFDALGRVVLETIPPAFSPVEEHLDLHLPILPSLLRALPAASPPEELEVAALLTNRWTNNYWHWIIDVLPRLAGLERYAAETGVRPRLLLPPRLRTWQLESLRAVAPDVPTRAWGRRRIRIRRFVIPSFRRQYDGRSYHRPVSADACRWLRDRVLARLGPWPARSTPRRIYVSRGDAAFRRVVNEDDVVLALEDAGYEACVPGRLTFDEQVRLFSAAEAVVAPHGAGLANLVFADAPTVLELFGPGVLPPNAYLARGLGCRYGYLRGTRPRAAFGGRESPMVVDVGRLMELLATMGAA